MSSLITEARDGAHPPPALSFQATAARRGWGMPSFLKSTRKMAFTMLAVYLAFVSPADAREIGRAHV